MDLALADRNRIVKLFRQQSLDIESENQGAFSSRDSVLRDAIESKHSLIRELETRLNEIEKSLDESKDALATSQREVEFVTHYRDTEQRDLAKQILGLKEAIQDEKSSFEKEKRHVVERFERSKQMISGKMGESVQGVQRRASDFALGRMDVKEKVCISMNCVLPLYVNNIQTINLCL